LGKVLDQRWTGIVDALGHCLLVFAFLPPLAALPDWLRFELTNRLNVEQPIVGIFLPVRGFIRLLNEFYAGIVPALVAGCIDGVLLCAWAAWSRAVSRPLIVGAATGTLSALAMLGGFALSGVDVRSAAWFEVASGTVCGAIAAPAALRFLSQAKQASPRSGLGPPIGHPPTKAPPAARSSVARAER
jgi:hypothetical protein